MKNDNENNNKKIELELMLLLYIMPNLYIIYVLLIFNIVNCYFIHQFPFNIPLTGAEMNGLERLLCESSMRKGVKNRYVKMLNLDKHLPSIIQYSESLNHNKTTEVENSNIYNPSGMDMHMNDSEYLEKESQLIHKIVKQQYFSKLLNILESSHSDIHKIEEIQKNPFLDESSPRPFNSKSGGLFKNWEDDKLL